LVIRTGDAKRQRLIYLNDICTRGEFFFFRGVHVRFAFTKVKDEILERDIRPDDGTSTIT
jgi:hypothetical protein